VLEADRVDTRVRSLAAGEFPERVGDVDVFIVENLSLTLRCCQCQTLGKPVDGNDSLRAQQTRALNGELAYWPTAPHRNGVARFDVAVLSRHVTGREDVREEKHLLVG